LLCQEDIYIYIYIYDVLEQKCLFITVFALMHSKMLIFIVIFCPFILIFTYRLLEESLVT